MSIYDTKNEDALRTQGWKSYKDSTLKSMSKDDLIDQIRCLEHNWAGEIKANKLLSYRLKRFADVLTENGHPEFSLSSNSPLAVNIIIGVFIFSSFNTFKISKPFFLGNIISSNIKSYSPCYYELDYDWDEEPIDNYQSLDIDYIIENIRETMKIDEEEKNKNLFGMWDLSEMGYFTEEEQKAEEEIIKKMAVEPKENFYDYYEEEEKKND